MENKYKGLSNDEISLASKYLFDHNYKFSNEVVRHEIVIYITDVKTGVKSNFLDFIKSHTRDNKLDILDLNETR